MFNAPSFYFRVHQMQDSKKPWSVIMVTVSVSNRNHMVKLQYPSHVLVNIVIALVKHTKL